MQYFISKNIRFYFFWQTCTRSLFKEKNLLIILGIQIVLYQTKCHRCTLKCLLTIVSQKQSPNNHGHRRKLCSHQALLESQITSNGLIPNLLSPQTLGKTKSWRHQRNTEICFKLSLFKWVFLSKDIRSCSTTAKRSFSAHKCSL